MPQEMQVAILAGGLATRLRPVTEQIPKSMVEIVGKPFLEYQVELLRRNDVCDIVLCVGHLSEQIKDYFGDGTRYGVHLTYSDEGEQRLGTGGALKLAEPALADVFFVLFGDSYLMLDYRAIMDYFLARDRQGLMVVYHNENRYDSSDVLVEDGLVTAYDKGHPVPGMIYINHGLSIMRKQILAAAPSNTPFTLETLMRQVTSQGQLLAFETKQRFYEIGSFAGLQAMRQLVAKGGLSK
jgi:NDP-sugar pyrophosphorylase family protein